MSSGKELYRPKILVLEGLYSDTKDIVNLAGGDATEAYPMSEHDVDQLMTYGEFDGLLLTGGGDVFPGLYNEKPHANVYGVDHHRDNAEIMALMHAEDQGIPVLGICRGSQIMTVYKGGKLKQDINGHRGGTHPVVATPDARTFKRAINSRGMDVISLHHQCVRRPGKGMRIAARALDGTPEAVESKDGLWLGVQYHPEMAALRNGNAFAIFQWLVQTAARIRGKRAPKVRFRDLREIITTYSSSGDSCSSARTTVGKHRKAGTRQFSGASTTTTTCGVDGKNPPSHDNPCPCDDEKCVYGFRCGRSHPSGLAEDADAPFHGDDGTGGSRPDGMRVMKGGEEEMLYVCPSCAMLFDFKQDRDDHVTMAHATGHVTSTEIERRYPELLPPPGHEAWDDAEVIDAKPWEILEPSDRELSVIEETGGRIARHVLAAE